MKIGKRFGLVVPETTVEIAVVRGLIDTNLRRTWPISDGTGQSDATIMVGSLADSPDADGWFSALADFSEYPGDWPDGAEVVPVRMKVGIVAHEGSSPSADVMFWKPEGGIGATDWPMLDRKDFKVF